VLGHIVGVGAVLALILMKPFWSKATRDAAAYVETTGNPDQDQPASPSLRWPGWKGGKPRLLILQVPDEC